MYIYILFFEYYSFQLVFRQNQLNPLLDSVFYISLIKRDEMWERGSSTRRGLEPCYYVNTYKRQEYHMYQFNI